VPTPQPIEVQTVSLASPTLKLTLASTEPASDPPTYAAKVIGYSAAYNLQQQYHFQGLGYYTTPDGVKVYALQSATPNANGNNFYLLTSSGAIYAYDGGSRFGTSLALSANLVRQLDPGLYLTPSLLTNAQRPVVPNARIVVVGNQLTIDVTGLSVGTTFEILVTVSDGLQTDRTGFLVTVTA
jgi:hypothetical protein